MSSKYGNHPVGDFGQGRKVGQAEEDGEDNVERLHPHQPGHQTEVDIANIFSSHLMMLLMKKMLAGLTKALY